MSLRSSGVSDRPALCSASASPRAPVAMRHQFVEARDRHGLTHARRPIDELEHEIERHFRLRPGEQRLKSRKRNAPALGINEEESEGTGIVGDIERNQHTWVLIHTEAAKTVGRL